MVENERKIAEANMDCEHKAYIQVSRHIIEPHGHYETYEWIGKREWPALIHNEDEDKLPWKFIKIEFIPSADGWLCIRKDALFPFGWLVFAREKIDNFFYGIKCRTIYTFHIWGIGYTPEYETPVWGNLKRKRP